MRGEEGELVCDCNYKRKDKEKKKKKAFGRLLFFLGGSFVETLRKKKKNGQHC